MAALTMGTRHNPVDIYDLLCNLDTKPVITDYNVFGEFMCKHNFNIAVIIFHLSLIASC